MSSAAKKIIESNPYVREEREKKEAADNKKKAHANKDSENKKRQKVTDLDEKHGR